MVQEQEAIRNLTALGWGIRRIARQLKVSRNTVRLYVRTLEPPAPLARKLAARNRFFAFFGTHRGPESYNPIWKT